MPNKIKIIVADDHELFRKGIISLLKLDSKISIVGEAESGKTCIDLLKRIDADIVLLDLEMPNMDGNEALKIITKRFPRVRVIILSLHYSEILVTEFMSRGANAYLFKNIKPEILFDAIYSVYSKGNYFDHGTAKAILSGLKKEKALFNVFDKLSLTQRENEILKLLCQDKSNKEIGECLSIEPRTVAFHRKNIHVKTGSKKTAGLVLFAVRNGIISPSQNEFPYA